jgi:hypothetical protein
MFFTSGAKRCAEVDEDENGGRRVHRYIKVEGYLTAEARKVTLMLPKPVQCGAQAGLTLLLLAAKADDNT